MPLTTGAVSSSAPAPACGASARRDPPRRRGRAARGSRRRRRQVQARRGGGESPDRRGSFGIVYQGKIDKRKAGDVVLKRPKLTVEGAAELQEVEAWMNDRVARRAGRVAPTFGSFVTLDEACLNARPRASSRRSVCGSCGSTRATEPSPSTWLSRTIPLGIAKALLGREGERARRRRCGARGDPGGDSFKNPANVHRARMVHRDIKPHNLVLIENGPGGEVQAHRPRRVRVFPHGDELRAG